MTPLSVNFGDRKAPTQMLCAFAIREVRARLGLDRGGLAALLSQRTTMRQITAESVEGWEIGRNVPPSEALLQALALADLDLITQIRDWLG